jgi:hypothetical protein
MHEVCGNAPELQHCLVNLPVPNATQQVLHTKTGPGVHVTSKHCCGLVCHTPKLQEAKPQCSLHEVVNACMNELCGNEPEVQYCIRDTNHVLHCTMATEVDHTDTTTTFSSMPCESTCPMRNSASLAHKAWCTTFSPTCNKQTLVLWPCVVIRLEMSPHASAVLFVSLVAET